MTPAPVCPYCGCPTALVTADYIYGDRAHESNRYLYYCLICGAYVRCHKGGTVPMGTPADRNTRQARRQAHREFDRIWKRRKMTRWEAYLWLSEQMGLPQDKTHIGMFDADQCARVVHLCKTLWKGG